MKIESNTAKSVYSRKNDEKGFNLYREHRRVEPILLERCLELEDQLRRQTAELTKAKEERDVLLREINHRVNNNLQVISSMLRMQSFEDDPEAYRKFQNRIHSMALVHKVLHESENLSSLNMATYIDRLGSALVRSHNLSRGQVSLDIDIQDVYLDLDSCVLCGFLLNELITNSLTHGFPNGNRGVIKISCRVDGGRVGLHVSDNGIGLPADVDAHSSTTLGLSLVKTFVSQLGGTLAVRPGPGLCYAIEFPHIKC
ncbi:MAG: sensor histidine kinase [Balneolales bacterium]